MLNDLGCKQKLSMSYSYVTRCALSSFNKIHFMYFEDQLILHHLAITVKLWYNTIPPCQPLDQLCNIHTTHCLTLINH